MHLGCMTFTYLAKKGKNKSSQVVGSGFEATFILSFTLAKHTAKPGGKLAQQKYKTDTDELYVRY